jgi:arabinan endo-1,5-alpha-L-arabinosidase
MRKFITPLAALFLSACASLAPTPTSTFRNPVIDADFPDPAVIKSADGSYYVYATQGGAPQRNIQVARSADLASWQMLGDAMPVKPSWASKTQDFWAPDAMAMSGRYYLYFSAKPDAALTNDKLGLCLGVATSARPEGPFVDSGKPLQCGPGFVNIDPFAFDDPVSGKKLLYWGSGFAPIKVQELADDRMGFAPGSKPIDLIAPDKTDSPDNYRRLVEGAWVVRRGGYYYLFFSGDNCCGDKAHYAVMVARSKSATGPFETRTKPLDLVVHGNAKWIAPGHNSVVQDSRGQDWILYHGVDAAQPRSKPSDDVNSRRVMLMDRLNWVDGWPEVAGRVPSGGDQPGPVVTR